MVAINEDLVDAPELASEDPYGKAGFFKLELADKSQLNDLLDADATAAAMRIIPRV